MNRKFHFSWLLTVSLVLFGFLFGCSDSDDDQATKLNLNPTSVSFLFDEVDVAKPVKVDTDAPSFNTPTIEYTGEEKGWLKTNNTTDGFEVIATSKNNGEETRNATITVKAGGLTKQLTVEQTSAITGKNTLKVTPEAGYEFAWDEIRTDKTLTVTTNANEFKFELEDKADEEWLDVNRGTGSIVYVAVKNDNRAETPRVGTIVFTAGSADPVKIDITQTEYIETDFTITFPNGEDSETMPFASSGELSKTIEVTTNGTELKAEIPAADGWVKKAAFEGKVLTIEVEENAFREPRETTITITNEQEGTATLTIKQEAKPALDLSGEWIWSSTSSISGDHLMNNAKPFTGTVTITPITLDLGATPAEGEELTYYTITGIEGLGLTDGEFATLGIENPKFYIQTRSKGAIDIIEVVGKAANPMSLVAFDTGVGLDAYFGIMWRTTGMPTLATFANFACAYAIEDDNETITFPNEHVITEEEIPGAGGMAINLLYTYYLNMGMNISAIEYHKDLTLTRTK